MIQKIAKDLVVFNGNDMDNNAYLLIKSNHCIIIDPSSYAQMLKSYINEHQLILDAILLTHGHFDHIESINELLKEFKIKVYCHKLEQFVIDKFHCGELMNNPNWKAPLELFSFYFNDETAVHYKDEELKVGNFKLKVFSTPGHTSGSTCYYYQHYFFTGDTIFYDGIGRSDLPTGNQFQLFNSIKKIIKILKPNDLILPGHCQKYETYKKVSNMNPYIMHFRRS